MTARQNVVKDGLHALLVKSVVHPKRNDVFQQAGPVDFGSCVVDLDACPVRLGSHWTIGFQ